MTDTTPLEARKAAEADIEVFLERFTGDEKRALLYSILRILGWNDQRADLVLGKARWKL